MLVNSFAGNYPLWSLAYEIWFYFLAGCLAVWIMSSAGKRIMVGFLLALGFVIFTKLEVVFLFAWILGASTYWLCSKPKNMKLAMIGGIFVVVGYMFSQLRSATVSVDMSTWLQYVPSSGVATLILSLGIALLLPYLTKLVPKSKQGNMVNELGRKLATFSYTLYLTHYPVLYILEHYMVERFNVINFESITWYMLRIVTCVVIGWLFYLPFERHTSRVRKKLQTVFVDRQPSRWSWGK